MKNRNYPLYDVTEITSIADMLEKKAAQIPDDSAVRYRKGREGVESKSYSEVYLEVKKAASWIGQNYGKGNHIALIGENSYEWLLGF